jgi:hypothetical protein
VLWLLLGITDVLAAFTGKRDNITDSTPFREWASTEHQRLLASHPGQFIFRLVSDIHFADIGSLYWENCQRHAPCRIWRMSINGASTIHSFASCLIYFPIGCRHPLIKYWQHLHPKITAKLSLPHPENDCQWSVNSFSWCIFGNQGIVLIFTFIMDLLTAMIAKNTIYQRYTPIPN